MAGHVLPAKSGRLHTPLRDRAHGFDVQTVSGQCLLGHTSYDSEDCRIQSILFEQHHPSILLSVSQY
jgi:hypothetical protein